MTDTHVIGPQYVCCSESNWVDDDSIEKTVARLTAVRDEVNAITPAPAMVFVMGDVVHAAHVSRDPLWYREHVNAYTIAAQEFFAGFHMPQLGSLVQPERTPEQLSPVRGYVAYEAGASVADRACFAYPRPRGDCTTTRAAPPGPPSPGW